MEKNSFDVIIIGGGAAGFFAAINIAQAQSSLKIAILEKGKQGLQKVKISGGGRCNVTHAEFVPSDLVTNYPRGEKELLGPFHTFMTGDTIAWFEERGIPLKIEEDGRMFPVSDSSQTIIDCFLNEAKRLQISILYNHTLVDFNQREKDWLLATNQGEFIATNVVMATGSSPKMWKLIRNLGHKIIDPVPSLFTFDIQDNRIKDIPGVVVQNTHVSVLGTKLVSSGPILITHVGLSAPAILKLSAFGALELAKLNYHFKIKVNFTTLEKESCIAQLLQFKNELAKKQVFGTACFDIPKRLWRNLVLASGIVKEVRWAELNKNQLQNLASQLTEAIFEVTGKSTFKEEFVTAGGVELAEVNFKTFESKLFPNLYFAGEVLNIDAVTGGFNFQNAWTGAFMVAQAISKKF